MRKIPKRLPAPAAMLRGPDQVAAPGPERGAKDPSAVERKCGNKVEQRQDKIDQRKVPQYAGNNGGTVPCCHADQQGIAHGRKKQAGSRTCCSHQQFVTRTVGFGRHLRDATEDEQSDAVDGQTVVAGDHRMRHLVKYDGHQQAGGRQARHDPIVR